MARDLPRSATGITVTRVPVTICDGNVSIGEVKESRP